MRRVALAATLILPACTPHPRHEQAQTIPPLNIRREARSPIEADWDRLAATTTTTTRTRPNRASRGERRTSSPAAGSGDLLDRLAQCESGMNPRAVSASGRYRGAFQWLPTTWRSLGGTGDPVDATYDEQKVIAARIPVAAWPRQFPACSRVVL